SVRHVDRAGHSAQDGHGLRWFEGASSSREFLPQRSAAQQLHDEEGSIRTGEPEVVDANDVEVDARGHQSCFFTESVHAALLYHMLPEHFHRDRTVQRRIETLVDVCKRALADLAIQAVPRCQHARELDTDEMCRVGWAP